MTMNVIESRPLNVHPIVLGGPIGYEDPLDADTFADVPVVTTRRGLIRVAMIASETTARFQREQVPHDPMAWMLAPRQVFEGGSAIESCLERDGFMRGLLLHGLGFGLDADPDDIDAVTGDDEDDCDGDDDRARDGASFSGNGGDGSGGAQGPKLFTSLLVHEDEDGTTHAFDATIAGTLMEARARLAVRRGFDLAEVADIREGFDADLPLVEALVSPAVANMLAQVAGAPASALARGLEVSIEQRFAA